MRWGMRCLVVLVLLAASAGPASAAPPSPSRPTAVAPRVARSATVPPSVAYAINRSLGADDDRFAIGQQGDSAILPRPGRPPIAFGDSGLQLTDPLDWTLRMTAVAGQPVGAASTVVAGNTAERLGDGWREWVVNGPQGVQHGWTIDQPIDWLTIDLASSLPVLIDGDGRGLYVVAAGQAVWRYSGLLAFDATGRTLPARLVATPAGVRIAVETTGAEWPVTVDPLLSETTLTATGGAASDFLGFSVAVSADGTTVVAGAYSRDNPGAVNSGAAYVFVRPGANWPATLSHTAILTATGGAANDGLGYAVAVSADGGTVVAGANNRSASTGAAYVFVRPGATWPAAKNQDSLLTATGGASGDLLGVSVAVSADGGTVVAGAPGFSSNIGAAYVFNRSGATWPTNKNHDSLLTAIGGVANDYLGYFVAVSADGGTVAAGAFGRTGTVGAAYVFVRPGATWPTTKNQDSVLTATGGAANDNLGISVALSADGTTVVAGAPGRSSSTGAAYVFVRPGATWPATKNQDSLLTATGGAVGDLLGGSVAVSANGGTVVAGAFFRAGATGAAYLFARPVSGWPTTQVDIALLQSSTGTTGEYFGRGLGISGDGGTVAAGLFGRNSAAGAAAVFSPGMIATATSFGSLPSAVPGQSAFIPVNVTAPTGTPSGTVEVTDGSVSCTAAVVTGGCALTFGAGGVRGVMARYLGNGNYLPSSALGSVSVVAPPTNVAIATGGLPQAGTPILFAATSSGGPGTTYSWDFGDGSPAQTGTVLQHTYATGGSYTVTATATNTAGSANASITIEVVRTLFAPTAASQASTGW